MYVLSFSMDSYLSQCFCRVSCRPYTCFSAHALCICCLLFNRFFKLQCDNCGSTQKCIKPNSPPFSLVAQKLSPALPYRTKMPSTLFKCMTTEDTSQTGLYVKQITDVLSLPEIVLGNAVMETLQCLFVLYT